MGYDMYVITKHDPTLTLAEEGYPWAEAESLPKEKKLEWWTARSTPEFYLRRNISGMSYLRADLVEVDAAFEDYDFDTAWGGNPRVQGRSFPELNGEWEDHFDENDKPKTELGKWHQEQVEAHLRWRPERPGIPIHKLCDNSGWIVTSEECVEALEAIEEHRKEHGGALPSNLHRELPDDDWRPWDDVLPFLKSAAANGGFRVY